MKGWGFTARQALLVTRRQALGILGLLMAAACLRRSEADSRNDWEDTCRRWMKVILPEDLSGPGADCPAVWKEFHHRLDADEVPREKIISGLALPALAQVPDPRAIDALFESDTEEGRFLNSFRDLVVTTYYSCEAGWKDLGFTAPPQPGGYMQ